MESEKKKKSDSSAQISKSQYKRLISLLKREGNAKYIACIAILLALIFGGLTIWSLVLGLQNAWNQDSDMNEDDQNGGTILIQHQQKSFSSAMKTTNYRRMSNAEIKVTADMIRDGLVNILSGQAILLDTAFNYIKAFEGIQERDVIEFYFVNTQRVDVRIVLPQNSGINFLCNNGVIYKLTTLPILMVIQNTTHPTISFLCINFVNPSG
jgi:hypothetical protein